MVANLSMDLSVVIVNWHSVDCLRQCLRSVHDRIQGLEFEVIVIDNASYDGSAEVCAKEFPQVVFIQAEQNLGFARANNRAFAQSSGRSILFLNPDTELLDDAALWMHQHLHSAANIGAVGCRVLNSDRTPQLQYLQASPNLLNQALSTNLLLRLFPKSRLWGCAPMLGAGERPCPVDIICGSCLMVKREVFEQIGGFDEDYFMYAEDVALCHAIRHAGYEVQYRGRGSVIHHCAKSSSAATESHFSALMQRESMALFFQKSRGRVYAGLFRIAVAIGALGRFACLPLLALVKLFSGKVSELTQVGRKWWRLLKWSLGRERAITASGKNLPRCGVRRLASPATTVSCS